MKMGRYYKLFVVRKERIVNHNINSYKHLGNCGKFDVVGVQTINYVVKI